eukprot:11338400-Karenia_brevis.AAC.1
MKVILIIAVTYVLVTVGMSSGARGARGSSRGTTISQRMVPGIQQMSRFPRGKTVEITLDHQELPQWRGLHSIEVMQNTLCDVPVLGNGKSPHVAIIDNYHAFLVISSRPTIQPIGRVTN